MITISFSNCLLFLLFAQGCQTYPIAPTAEIPLSHGEELGPTESAESQLETLVSTEPRISPTPHKSRNVTIQNVFGFESNTVVLMPRDVIHLTLDVYEWSREFTPDLDNLGDISLDIPLLVRDEKVLRYQVDGEQVVVNSETVGLLLNEGSDFTKLAEQHRGRISSILLIGFERSTPVLEETLRAVADDDVVVSICSHRGFGVSTLESIADKIVSITFQRCISELSLSDLHRFPRLESINLAGQYTRRGLSALSRVDHLRKLEIYDHPVTFERVRVSSELYAFTLDSEPELKLSSSSLLWLHSSSRDLVRDLLDEPAELPNLMFIDLRYVEPSTVRALGRYSKLQSLRLTEDGLVGVDISDIVRSDALRIVEIKSDPDEDTVLDLDTLLALPSLEELTISGIQLAHPKKNTPRKSTGIRKVRIDGMPSQAGNVLSRFSFATKLENLSHRYRTPSSAGLDLLRRQAGSLRSLDLSSQYGWGDQAVIDVVGQLEGLQTLALDGVKGPVDLSPLESLRSLEHLSLVKSCPQNADYSFLRGMKKLRYLDLEGSCIDDAGLSELAESTELQVLRLGETKITDVGLSALAALKFLYTLELNGDAVTSTGLAHIKSEGTLTALNLMMTHIDDSGADEIARHTKLRVLDLTETKVGDKTLSKLSKLSSLSYLSLNATKITDWGLIKLRSLEQLTTLDISDTKITDRGFSVIGSLRRLRNLSAAQMWKVSSKCYVRNITKLPSLLRLNLDRTNLKSRGLKRLMKMRSLVSLSVNDSKVDERLGPDLAEQPWLKFFNYENRGGM